MRRAILSFLMLLSVYSVAAACCTVTLHGRIETAIGDPVPGVIVIMEGSEYGVTKTDEAGLYTFPGVSPVGVYLITPTNDEMTFTPANALLGIFHYEANFTTEGGHGFRRVFEPGDSFWRRVLTSSRRRQRRPF